jgi:hypothetical protein
MKLLKHFSIVLIISICLAGAISFGMIYLTAKTSASQMAADLPLTTKDFESLAKGSALEASVIQQSYEQARQASDNPLSYPEFNRYWGQSFLALLPIVLLLTAAVRYWIVRRKQIKR